MVRVLKNFSYASIALILFIIGLNRFMLFTPSVLDDIASDILYSSIKFQNYLFSPYYSWLEKKRRTNELSLEIAALATANENLRAQVIELQAKQNFGQSTAEVIEFAKNYSQSGILAQVILRNFDDNKHFFFIDKGKNSRVNVDMFVAYKNCLVGRVEQVYENYSKVILITDKNCKVASFCVLSNTHGIHEGVNKTKISSLGYVNHLEAIFEKELVLSSGEGLIFPRGFALGTIQKFSKDGLNYNIEVDPALDFEKLEFCYVLKKGTGIATEQPDTLPQVEHTDSQESGKP